MFILKIEDTQALISQQGVQAEYIGSLFQRQEEKLWKLPCVTGNREII